jgi:hypothetical protein
MPTQPFERPLLGLLANLGEPNPWGPFEHIKEQHSGPVPSATPKEGPGLSADVIGRYELAASVAPEQRGSVAVAAVATVMESNPERCVNKNHG